MREDKSGEEGPRSVQIEIGLGIEEFGEATAKDRRPGEKFGCGRKSRSAGVVVKPSMSAAVDL